MLADCKPGATRKEISGYRREVGLSRHRPLRHYRISADSPPGWIRFASAHVDLVWLGIDTVRAIRSRAVVQHRSSYPTRARGRPVSMSGRLSNGGVTGLLDGPGRPGVRLVGAEGVTISDAAPPSQASWTDPDRPSAASTPSPRTPKRRSRSGRSPPGSQGRSSSAASRCHRFFMGITQESSTSTRGPLPHETLSIPVSPTTSPRQPQGFRPQGRGVVLSPHLPACRSPLPLAERG